MYIYVYMHAIGFMLTSIYFEIPRYSYLQYIIYKIIHVYAFIYYV